MSIFTSIRRTPYQSLAAFSVLFFTLLLSTAIFMALSFLFGFLGYVETRPQVVVYFQSQTPENDIFKLRNELLASGKVSSAKYISKKDAYNIYKESTKDNPLFLEMTSPDILPASLELNAKKPEQMPEIATYLKKQPGVDEVQFRKDIVDRLLALTSMIRKTSFILFSYLIFMSVMVLITIILFKIALKREEIEVLRLLGASSFYIKKPFLKEGLFYGFSSAFAAFALLGGALFYCLPFLTSYLRGVPALTLTIAAIPFTIWPIHPEYLLFTFALSSLFGMSIAFIASYIATDKYLK